MLEHAVGFNLVKRCFEESLLFQFIVLIIIVNGRKFLSFLVEELKVRGTLILDIFRLLGFSSPLVFVAPLFLLFFVIVVRVFEIVFLLGLFTV